MIAADNCCVECGLVPGTDLPIHSMMLIHTASTSLKSDARKLATAKAYDSPSSCSRSSQGRNRLECRPVAIR